jgi:lysozyme
MTLLDDCHRLVIEDEGEKKVKGRHVVYRDSLGIWTIGHGINVDGDHGGGLYDDEVDFIRGRRITRTWTEIYNALPWLQKKPDHIKLGVFCMAYQLGLTRLLGFKNMLAALEVGNIEEACLQARSSKWARQTPARTERVTRLFKD